MRKVIYFVASSLDGFIAGPNGEVDWLMRVHKTVKGEGDYCMRELDRAIDTVSMGRATHDFALAHGMSGHPGAKNYIFTRSKPAGERDGVEYVAGDPAELVRKLRTKPGKDIWLMGGGAIARDFLIGGVLDELVVTQIPMLLGKGIPMFRHPHPEFALEVLESTPYKSGVVQLRCAVRGAQRSKAKSRRG
jgi:dihydrofolate reductase